MYPHRIRLRGPWELEQHGTRRVTLPCRWSELGVTGPVLLRRRFGYPGQIDTDERVWLTFDGIDGGATARLNEHFLGTIGSDATALDVTTLLRDRNVLELTATASPSGRIGEVALEVRRTAYLSDVQLRKDGENVRLTGKVVGECEGPLDLYVIAGRSTVGEWTIVARPEGQEFELRVDAPAAGGLRVELVRGSVVWYAVTV